MKFKTRIRKRITKIPAFQVVKILSAEKMNGSNVNYLNNETLGVKKPLKAFKSNQKSLDLLTKGLENPAKF